jgi:hypothetical protein
MRGFSGDVCADKPNDVADADDVETDEDRRWRELGEYEAAEHEALGAWAAEDADER